MNNRAITEKEISEFEAFLRGGERGRHHREIFEGGAVLWQLDEGTAAHEGGCHRMEGGAAEGRLRPGNRQCKALRPERFFHVYGMGGVQGKISAHPAADVPQAGKGTDKAGI